MTIPRNQADPNPKILSILAPLLARLDRSIASSNADLARKIARPGEPHAKARARIVQMQRQMNAQIERAVLFGEF